MHNQEEYAVNLTNDMILNRIRGVFPQLTLTTDGDILLKAYACWQVYGGGDWKLFPQLCDATIPVRRFPVHMCLTNAPHHRMVWGSLAFHNSQTHVSQMSKHMLAHAMRPSQGLRHDNYRLHPCMDACMTTSKSYP